MMKTSAGAGLLIAGLLLSGCCLFMKHPPPPPPNAAQVVLKPSIGVIFKHVWVHQEADKLVIQGTLHPRSFMQKDAGHVDVRIAGADGKTLRVLKIVPENPVFAKKNGRISPFSSTVDLVVSLDSTVYLKAQADGADK